MPTLPALLEHLKVSLPIRLSVLTATRADVEGQRKADNFDHHVSANQEFAAPAEADELFNFCLLLRSTKEFDRSSVSGDYARVGQ